MSTAPAWETQRSVEVAVPIAFAWRYMTDVRNWDDPPAEFALDGPFAAGSRGTTRMPGRPLALWTICDVEPGRAYTIESGSFLERALLRFHWRFDPISDRKARLTQRVELCGENAAAYVAEVRAGFEPNLEPGLRRLAERMTRAALESGRPRDNSVTSN
jgi:Polyketide cyclase / dehydrase and lipid transport